MKAMKNNKEYTITEELKARYLDEGYDIYDDKGELLEYSPKKKIEYSKYVALQKELETVKKELTETQEAQKTAKAEQESEKKK